MKPLVSVIVPAFNSEKTIEKCLNSIYSSDYKNFEVIVVDDASTDNTIGIIKEFPCKLIQLNENKGPARARNSGAKSARGEILLFVDSDVVIETKAISGIIDSFKDKAVAAVVGLFSKHTRVNGFFSKFKNFQTFYTHSNLPMQISTLFTAITAIRRDVFNKFKGFNEGFREMEDVELGARLTKKGYKIQLNKSIQVEHLKEYSFCSMLKNDFWKSFYNARLLPKYFQFKKTMREKRFTDKPINLMLSAPVSFLIALFLASFIVLKSPINAILLVISVFLFVLLNTNFWNFLRKEKGFLFAFASSFLTFIEALVIGFGVLIGLLFYVLKK